MGRVSCYAFGLAESLVANACLCRLGTAVQAGGFQEEVQGVQNVLGGPKKGSQGRGAGGGGGGGSRQGRGFQTVPSAASNIFEAIWAGFSVRGEN